MGLSPTIDLRAILLKIVKEKPRKAVATTYEEERNQLENLFGCSKWLIIVGVIRLDKGEPREEIKKTIEEIETSRREKNRRTMVVVEF